MRRTNNLWWVSLVAVLVAAAGFSTTLYSQSGSKGSESKAGTLNVTIEGVLQAKASGGSGAKNDPDHFTFKVIKATEDAGSELTELRNRILRFTNDAKSKDLLSKHSSGEKLLIKGSLKLDADLLTVKAFRKSASGAGGNSQGSGSK